MRDELIDLYCRCFSERGIRNNWRFYDPDVGRKADGRNLRTEPVIPWAISRARVEDKVGPQDPGN